MMHPSILEIVFWIAIGVLVYSYLGYPLVLIVLSRLFGRPVTIQDVPLPSVTVVVPVHNEEAVIVKKLENLLGQDYPPDKLNILIGSDMSTDATIRLVKEREGTRVGLREMPRRSGKTGVLNALVPEVGAEIVVFTDANTMHAPDAIRQLVRPFSDATVGGVAGHIDHTIDGKDATGETIYRTFEVAQKERESRLHSTISAFGGFYGIRRSLFHAIPPNAYSNDDVLIPMNVVSQGFRVVYESRARAWEDFTNSTRAEFSRRIRIGAGNFQSFFWLLGFLNPLRGWPWFCYVSHKVTRWFSPFFVITAATACGLLAARESTGIYGAFALVGAVGVASAACFRVIPTRVTRYSFYFLAMNLALLLGFFRYVRGIRSAAWSRSERGTVSGALS